MNSAVAKTKPTPIAVELANFTARLEYTAIPEIVRERAKHLILDAVGIAYASTAHDFARRAQAAVSEFGTGNADVIGLALKLPLRDAVLLNGVLVHGLDYDDTHVGGVVHATSSCFPCALGVAADTGASGRALLVAYIAGMEATTRLGAVACGGFHQVGFHPTGVVGAFGGALIAGKLRGLDAPALAQAQGIALSFASGSLEFLQDGAWTKRLHPGWAGVAGITAAAFARHGFVGPRAAYEGRFGLFNSYLGSHADKSDLALATAGLGTKWEVAEVAVKPLPACHFTHACADAAATLYREHRVQPEDIVSVRALVPKEVITTVCEPVATKQRPQNSYDAQFSIPYIVAVALIRGRFGLADLDDASLRDPAILALAHKVHYEIDPDSAFPRAYSGEVVVRLKDGRELRHREATNRGAPDRPLTNSDIVDKFMDNAGTVISRTAAATLRDAVLSLNQVADSRVFSRMLAVSK